MSSLAGFCGCMFVTNSRQINSFLSTSQPSFLHGRFVWASWDVNELQSGEARQRIDNDVAYLRLGVHGL